ncbi:MAG: hypothetical protein M1828_004013 [Chrysothrix sp. TS-e1954]|nr:MAG: hypothetical protein M1828_004013 [Chrysothrix sp. TS-e1954]
MGKLQNLKRVINQSRGGRDLGDDTTEPSTPRSNDSETSPASGTPRTSVSNVSSLMEQLNESKNETSRLAKEQIAIREDLEKLKLEVRVKKAAEIETPQNCKSMYVSKDASTNTERSKPAKLAEEIASLPAVCQDHETQTANSKKTEETAKSKQVPAERGLDAAPAGTHVAGVQAVVSQQSHASAPLKAAGLPAEQNTIEQEQTATIVKKLQKEVQRLKRANNIKDKQIQTRSDDRLKAEKGYEVVLGERDQLRSDVGRILPELAETNSMLHVKDEGLRSMYEILVKARKANEILRIQLDATAIGNNEPMLNELSNIAQDLEIVNGSFREFLEDQHALTDNRKRFLELAFERQIHLREIANLDTKSTWAVETMMLHGIPLETSETDRLVLHNDYPAEVWAEALKFRRAQKVQSEASKGFAGTETTCAWPVDAIASTPSWISANDLSRTIDHSCERLKKADQKKATPSSGDPPSSAGDAAHQQGIQQQQQQHADVENCPQEQRAPTDNQPTRPPPVNIPAAKSNAPENGLNTGNSEETVVPSTESATEGVVASGTTLEASTSRVDGLLGCAASSTSDVEGPAKDAKGSLNADQHQYNKFKFTASAASNGFNFGGSAAPAFGATIHGPRFCFQKDPAPQSNESTFKSGSTNSKSSSSASAFSSGNFSFNAPQNANSFGQMPQTSKDSVKQHLPFTFSPAP